MNPENPSEKKPMDCIVSEDGCACDYCEDIRKRLTCLQSQNEKLVKELATCRELSDLRLDGETRLRKENSTLLSLVRECSYAISAIQMLIEEDMEEGKAFSFRRKQMIERCEEAISLIEKAGVVGGLKKS